VLLRFQGFQFWTKGFEGKIDTCIALLSFSVPTVVFSTIKARIIPAKRSMEKPWRNLIVSVI